MSECPDDSKMLDWLAAIVEDERYHHDVILQSDEEDGVWVGLRAKGSRGTHPLKGQDSHASNLRDAIAAAMQKSEIMCDSSK